MLRNLDPLECIQPANIFESKQPLDQRLTFDPRLGIIDRNTTGSGNPLLNHLVAIAVVTLKNAKAIGRLVNSFETGDIHVILR